MVSTCIQTVTQCCNMNGTLQHQSLHRITYGCDHVLSSYSPNGRTETHCTGFNVEKNVSCTHIRLFCKTLQHELVHRIAYGSSTHIHIFDKTFDWKSCSGYCNKILQHEHRDECIFTHIHLFNKMLQYELMHRNSCTGLCIEMNVSGNHTHLVNKVLQHELLCRIRQSYSPR